MNLNGCEQNIATDANNCGGCGVKCPQGLVCVQQSCTCPQCKIPNAKSVCINNVCVLDSCLPGFANCDGDPSNGCEADLNSDAANCSKCGMNCGANMACALGTCTTCGANLIDNGGILCVPKGMSYAISGDKCYSSQIIVNGTLSVTPAMGGAGGASVLLLVKSAQIDGTISVVGEKPPVDKAACGYHPGGGGGGGGGIVIRAETLTGAGTLVADGGQGGDSTGSGNDWGWSGGGGGGGRIKIFASSDQFKGSMSVLGGKGGGTCGGAQCTVGLPGLDGTTSRSNSIPNLWNTIMCGGL